MQIDPRSEEFRTMAEKVGFIGVGAMGSAIASRLLDRYELWVNDRNPRAADDLIAKGATFASAEDIARNCTYVFLSLPGPQNVTELFLGPSGIAGLLSPGSVVIDTTTGTPTADEGIVAALKQNAVDYVDSPIGGGVRRAHEGTATLMVGADDDVFERVKDILHQVTATVFHVGPVGAGHAMKLVNNLLNSINRFAALEAVRLGQACGITQDMVIEVLNQSTGRNYTTEYSFTQLRSGDTWKPQGFTLDLMLKDLQLANELAEAVGHSTPIGHLVVDFTKQAIARFGGDADQSQLMAEWYEPRD
jgi:3-hydroxyisobutyrate dehydrogenase-like beta-hydroxyacid dehydrogenase